MASHNENKTDVINLLATDDFLKRTLIDPMVAPKKCMKFLNSDTAETKCAESEKLSKVYEAFTRSKNVEPKWNNITGVGIYAKQTIKMPKLTTFKNLTYIRGFAIPIDLDKYRDRMISIHSMITKDGDIHALIGPISLVNGACEECANARFNSKCTQIQLTRKVRSGEQILVWYGDDYKIECPICGVTTGKDTVLVD